MSDPATHKPLKWYQDDDGDTSLGRIVVLMGVLLGILITLSGAALLVWETLTKAGTNNGFALAGAGIGLISAAFALKGWQRVSEAKIANGATS